MAADRRGADITAGGATINGMLPQDVIPETHGLLSPEVMGPPVVWLASDDAAGP